MQSVPAPTAHIGECMCDTNWLSWICCQSGKEKNEIYIDTTVDDESREEKMANDFTNTHAVDTEKKTGEKMFAGYLDVRWCVRYVCVHRSPVHASESLSTRVLTTNNSIAEMLVYCFSAKLSTLYRLPQPLVIRFVSSFILNVQPRWRRNERVNVHVQFPE